VAVNNYPPLAVLLLVMALVIGLILSAIYYQRTINWLSRSCILQIVQLVLLFFLAKDLVLHTLRWSVVNAYTALGVTPRDRRPRLFSRPGYWGICIDPEYGISGMDFTRNIKRYNPAQGQIALILIYSYK